MADSGAAESPGPRSDDPERAEDRSYATVYPVVPSDGMRGDEKPIVLSGGQIDTIGRARSAERRRVVLRAFAEGLADYRQFVGYAVFPGILAYIVAALVSDNSLGSSETFRQLLDGGSLYMLSIGLSGNMLVRVMSMKSRTARDNLHVWLMLLLTSSAAGFGVTAGNTRGELADDLVYASVFVFACVLLVGLLVSMAVVRDNAGRRD